MVFRFDAGGGIAGMGGGTGEIPGRDDLDAAGDESGAYRRPRPGEISLPKIPAMDRPLATPGVYANLGYGFSQPVWFGFFGGRSRICLKSRIIPRAKCLKVCCAKGLRAKFRGCIRALEWFCI